MAPRCVVLLLAATLLGVVAAKWHPSSEEQRKAELVTELEVNNDMMQQGAKEFYKFTGQKPPSAVDLDDVDMDPNQPKDVTKMMSTLAEATRLYNVMKYGRKKADQMAKNKTQTLPQAQDTSMTAAYMTGVTADYKKATGQDLSKVKKAPEEIQEPQNTKDVMKMLEGVGKDMHKMKQQPDKKFQGASQVYQDMLDRNIVVPDLKESNNFEDTAMNDAMATQTPAQMEESLGLDKVDDEYQADKAAAQDVLEAQSEKIANREFAQVDDFESDSDSDSDSANFDTY